MYKKELLYINRGFEWRHDSLNKVERNTHLVHHRNRVCMWRILGVQSPLWVVIGNRVNLVWLLWIKAQHLEGYKVSEVS